MTMPACVVATTETELKSALAQVQTPALYLIDDTCFQGIICPRNGRL